MRWDQFSTPDSAVRKKTLGADRMLAGPEPLQVRSEKVEAPSEPVVAADYDPDAAFVENEPHAWEKAVQRDEAAPADEFGRKNWHLHATKPDVNTNLFVQIIVDALEEARAEEICVVDVTNKHTYFPDQTDYVFISTAIYRRMDMMIWCTGKSAKHMETIAEAIMDRGKKGLIPVEYKKARMKIDVTDDSTQWRIQMPCGKIMLDILSPDKRDLEMYERKYACLVTDHSGRFMEDMLLSQGWIRVWDYWTPNAPVLPKNDFESVYCKERSFGYERLDLLKPEYVITDMDLQRRHSHTATTPGDMGVAVDELKEPISPEKWEELRRKLTENKRITKENPFTIVGQENGPVDPDTNVTFQMDETRLMTDEEMRVAIDRLRERTSPQNIHVESPETRERKDKEWLEYERYGRELVCGTDWSGKKGHIPPPLHTADATPASGSTATTTTLN